MDLPAQIRIERPLYDHENLRKDFEYEKNKKNYFKDVLCNCDNVKLKKFLKTTVPVAGWLGRYKWKSDFLSDLTAGFTVAIMHIPQGIGYAMLGNVPPVIGIYMAFFPVLVYFFLGTSRHNSMGTFSVICLMTGKAVLEHSHPSYFPKEAISNSTGSSNSPGVDPLDHFYSPVEVATAVTFCVGIFQLLMYILRLGSASALLSETLVSGFTTGAAVQVVVSQMKDLVGVRIPRHKGLFVVENTIASIIAELPNTNLAAVIITSVTIVILVFNNELLKQKMAKLTSFPVPIELIVIIIGSAVSYVMDLEGAYDIIIIKDIPSGLPEPQVPPLGLVHLVILDGFTIAIVSYTVSLSMALIFAQKLDYEVDANQEFLAQGAGNLVGSFFSCMPFTASLSRSTIQQTVGGKTQIASLVSCAILLVILLYVGPLFEPLPRCVLASVIVVALKGMLLQVKEFLHFFRHSKLDALVWMVTFLATVFIGVDIGLLLGIVMSLISIFILGFTPYTCLLGNVPHTELYLDIKKYKSASEIPGIKIFHFAGGLNFAMRNTFRSQLLDKIDLNPQKEAIYRSKLSKLTDPEVKETAVSKDELCKKIDKLNLKIKTDLKCLILDFSSVSYIDPSGVSMLKSLVESFEKIDILVLIAGASEPNYELMAKCNLFDSKKNFVKTFATVHDAVLCASDQLKIVLSGSSSVSTITSAI